MRYCVASILWLILLTGCGGNATKPSGLEGKWVAENMPASLGELYLKFNYDGTYELTMKSKNHRASQEDSPTTDKWKKLDDKTIEFSTTYMDQKTQIGKLIDDQTLVVTLPFSKETTYKRHAPK